ncbi:hypothetical protein M0R45_002473 [Rubus argutus]|uniref:Pentatricopeptide repeat-containing protein n=1 Tax=Rubus argutus TaxID=59490 RepID=A0AAW1VQU4_RUBAR
MLLLLRKAYSTTSTASKTWRTQIKQAQLASQISSILLQRRNWVPILQNLNLSKLTPPLFLQILHKTQNNPQLSLDFFNWAKSNLRFEPDLKSHCQIIQLSLGSGLIRPAKPILDSLIQTHPVPKLVQSMTQACKGTDSQTTALSFVLGCYSRKGLCREGIEVYKEMSVLGCVPSVLACNALLNAMRQENEIRLAWCFYGVMIRNEQKWEFDAAFYHLDKMSDGKLDLGFSTYSSILDGACKLGDVGVVERNATYGCMLKALTKEVRIIEAIRVYRMICERGIVVDDSSYYAFANVLSKEGRSEEGFELLMDVIRRGFSPCASELSGFISFLCGRGRWREAEDLLNLVLDKGLLPDLTCCSSLVGHYCSRRRIDSAMALHNKMEKLNGSLDVTTYNVLLGGFFAAGRVEEAVRVFDYMRRHTLMSSESFTIMIRGLCQVKELRKAMKIHDEMLKLGLKPPTATYKRLICGFK